MTGAHRQPALGVALRDPYPWDDLAALAGWIEDAGFRALFLPEVGARDTLAALSALAGETRTLLLGTGVVPLPSRSPALLAMAAATAQERSGGRLLLGLGTGPSAPGALDRLRRTVVALRSALSGGEAVVDGTPVAVGLPLASPPAIWIAALGPRATRLAGEVADGVLLNWCTPERVAEARRQVGEGAERAGRDPADVTIGVYLRAALVPGSLDVARSMAAEYASYPSYRRQFATMGIAPDPEAIVAAVIATEPDAARERLDAHRAAGADLPVVYPVLPPGPPEVAHARRTLEACIPAVP